MINNGGLLAIFGPDGTGKSTITNLLEQRCSSKGIKTRQYHWRPRLLPSLKADDLNVDMTHPDQLKQRSYIVSLFTYIYFFADFLLFYYLKMLSMILHGEIILYERYFYDIIFHPRRYKSREIKGFARFLAKIIPRPTWIVFLHGDPQIIHSRKFELSINEISRQQEQMGNYLKNLPHCISIDVSQLRPDDVARVIEEEISGL